MIFTRDGKDYPLAKKGSCVQLLTWDGIGWSLELPLQGTDQVHSLRRAAKGPVICYHEYAHRVDGPEARNALHRPDISLVTRM